MDAFYTVLGTIKEILAAFKKFFEDVIAIFNTEEAK